MFFFSRWTVFSGMAIIAAGLFLFVPAQAHEADEADGHDRSQDLIRIDDVVEISAPVAGDLFAFGRDVILRGDVGGDIIAAGQSVTILGNVQGDVRVIGATVTVSGSIDGSLTVLGRNVAITTSAWVGRTTMFFGGRADIDGTLGGEVLGRAREVHLRGKVNGDIHIPSSDTVELHPSLVANGEVIVTSTAPLRRHDDAVVHGAIEENRPTRMDTRDALQLFFFSRVVSFFSILLVGLVAVHLFRRVSFAIVSSMITAPLAALWKGVLLSILPPLVALLLFFTFIGIPLGGIIFALSGVLLYSARVFAGLAIGLKLLWLLDTKHHARSVLWPLCLGLAALLVLESIPFLGFVVTVFATWWSLGGMVLVVQGLRVSTKKS